MGASLFKPVTYYTKEYVSSTNIKVFISISGIPLEIISKELIIPLTRSYKKYEFKFENDNKTLVFPNINKIEFYQVILKMPNSFILKSI